MIFTLVTSDNKSFKVEKELLKHSGAITKLIEDLNLDNPDTDPSAMIIPIRSASGPILGKVIRWLRWHKDDPVPENEDDVHLFVKRHFTDWDSEFFMYFFQEFDDDGYRELRRVVQHLDIKLFRGMVMKINIDEMMRQYDEAESQKN